MQCHEFDKYSEQWMAGGRAPAAEAHVDACPRCRGMIAELERIAGVAPEMEVEMPEPAAERVWMELRGQLESEGLIRSRAVSAWLADLFAVLPRPALAGAYVGMLLAALMLGGLSLTEDVAPVQQFAVTDKLLQPQFAQAEQTEVAQLHHHDAAVIASYRDNLEIVDKFIAVCEKTVREEPRNQMAREYLYAAYQQKADLLTTMTEHGAGGDE